MNFYWIRIETFLIFKICKTFYTQGYKAYNDFPKKGLKKNKKIKFRINTFFTYKKSKKEIFSFLNTKKR